MKWPFVSVCLPTFKRPDFLSEFYWCYLQQDYPKDRRELIILDDAGQFTPFVDLQQNVKLVSTNRRFHTLGEKRNAFVSLMNEQSEFLLIADDDDLYFPHWISSLMKTGEKADIVVPTMMIEWIWGSDPEYRYAIHWGYHHAASAFRKTAFLELGGYPHKQRQEDCVIFSRFEANRLRYNRAEVCWKEFPYIVRRSGRWRGTYTTTWMTDEEYEATSKQDCDCNIILNPVSVENQLQMVKESLKKTYESDVAVIHSAIVGHAVLGINEMHYDHLDLPEGISIDTHLILSAHCPSEIKIHLKKKVRVQGFLNGSSQWSPDSACVFRIAGKPVGYLFSPKDVTRPLVLDPGHYTLEITSLVANWKHSLWAIQVLSCDET